MATTHYRSRCPIASALDVVGDRWTLVVVRELALGGKRTWKQLATIDEGIASNVLSDRLARLEGAGCVTRRVDPTDRRRTIYALTEQGAALGPVLVALARWGNAYLPHTDTNPEFYAMAEELSSG